MLKLGYKSYFSRSVAQVVKSAVKVPNEAHQGSRASNFDRNLPKERRVKAWERAGEDKDSWFKRKYAHVHAKENRREESRKIQDVEKRESKSQYQDHRAKFGNRNMISGLRPNPLMEYVYGTNSVISALRADKREYFSRILYHAPLAQEVQLLAKKKDIQLELVDKHRLNLLTNYAIHNNIVLETKPLQLPEIKHLGPCNVESQAFSYVESFFDESQERSENYLLKEGKQFPLGLFLDEVVDPHNMGAIIRSAYFLGVDFIVLSRRNCAPLSPAVAKTSSGATELLPIFNVDKPLDFFTKSQTEGGWTFVTAGVCSDNKFTKNKKMAPQDLHGMLQELPVVLVVGNEGTGVRTNLQMRSDFMVEIPKGRETSGTCSVDSLNVSVATAVLLNSLLS
ncbi:LANO_0H14180g1_1 [Lachancea nothofagi CBS 11611]|uniref:rRNA methyltransferase 1, mitochondrial n=1 Tax=Lachancea nothofagi CBS 11611 TaxID=1266666 RepID=A0A1G4KMK9_9SACH|nr:LANO_0H14180g1_1 [Lachancea nothofagi CBS 11611]